MVNSPFFMLDFAPGQAETLQNNTLAELSSRIAAAAAEKFCAVVVAGASFFHVR